MPTGLHRFAPAWLVVVAMVAATASTRAITPIWGTLPTATETAIATGAGNQTDPHESGDIVAFTADAAGGLTQIQYYDFHLSKTKSSHSQERLSHQTRPSSFWWRRTP